MNDPHYDLMHPFWDGHPRGLPQGGHRERLLPSTPHTAVTSLAVVLHGDAWFGPRRSPASAHHQALPPFLGEQQAGEGALGIHRGQGAQQWVGRSNYFPGGGGGFVQNREREQGRRAEVRGEDEVS